MEQFDKIDVRTKKYPKRIYATVPAEIYDALQKYGMSNIDILITNLLADYFENQESGKNENNKKQY